MRVSNEPCTDRSSNARRELAHERAFDGLAVYGECRDSNISCGAEQKAKRLRTCRHGSLRPTRSEPVGIDHCVRRKSEKYLTRAVLKKIPRCRGLRRGKSEKYCRCNIFHSRCLIINNQDPAASSHAYFSASRRRPPRMLSRAPQAAKQNMQILPKDVPNRVRICPRIGKWRTTIPMSLSYRRYQDFD